jgi:hypothetical protein
MQDQLFKGDLNRSLRRLRQQLAMIDAAIAVLTRYKEESRPLPSVRKGCLRRLAVKQNRDVA